jgi:enoyl-CoA hydratase/carnithine racemase
MSRATVIEERQEGVLLLTLNRPQRRNAFNDQQYNDVRSALADALADDAVRVVVITGAGGAFSAGQDINEMGSGRAFTPFVDQLATFDKPLIAAVSGVAVGIGITMLPHCDLVYVGDSARLRAPFVALGLVCEAGSSLLMPLTMGPQRAAEVLLTARWINAVEAVELGLAARRLADAELVPAALATAREIAAQPAAAVRQVKQLLLAIRSDALRAARLREDTLQVQRLGSAENLAAIRAFQTRRGPSSLPP